MSRFFKSGAVGKIEKSIDGLESSLSGAVGGSKYTDLGAGVKVPSKDVIRGLQRLHEARQPLFERVGQILNILTFVLVLFLHIR